MKRYMIPFLLGVFLIGFGGCFLFFEIIQFQPTQEIPEIFEKTETREYRIPLTDRKYYIEISNQDHIQVHYDPTYENEMKIEVTYAPILGDIAYHSYTDQAGVRNIYFYFENRHHLLFSKTIYDTLLDMFKKKIYYDMDALDGLEIDIYLNEANRDHLYYFGEISEEGMIDHEIYG